MSNSTLKSFAVIKITENSKNFAKPAGSLVVIKGNCLKNWNRDKWSNGDDLPENPIWEKVDDDGDEDIGCQILHINTKEKCDEFVQEQKKIDESNVTNQRYVTEEQFLESQNQISQLTKLLMETRSELKHLQNVIIPGHAVKSKLIQVANHEGWYIPTNSLSQFATINPDEIGFRKLMEQEFSDDNGKYFPGQTWTTIDPKERGKLEDLMALFVLHTCAREHGGDTKPSVAHAKFKKIHKATVSHFTQRNWRSGKKSKIENDTVPIQTKKRKSDEANIEALDRVEISLRSQNLTFGYQVSESESSNSNSQESPTSLLMSTQERND